jgi:hypothetical protein
MPSSSTSGRLLEQSNFCSFGPWLLFERFPEFTRKPISLPTWHQRPSDINRPPKRFERIELTGPEKRQKNSTETPEKEEFFDPPDLRR